MMPIASAKKSRLRGGCVVIPPRRHRKLPRDYDCIASNFLGFIKLASIMLWLK